MRIFAEKKKPFRISCYNKGESRILTLPLYGAK